MIGSRVGHCLKGIELDIFLDTEELRLLMHLFLAEAILQKKLQMWILGPACVVSDFRNCPRHYETLNLWGPSPSDLNAPTISLHAAMPF